jgi:hypothetical protein
MQITRTAPTEITIIGNIKSTADYLDIRKMVMAAVDDGAKALTLKIQESLSMPSSVIGFFVKLVKRDKVPVTMLIQDNRLVVAFPQIENQLKG